MKPLFDFNGDGEMDMLEFLIAAGSDSSNPINQENDSEYDFNEDEDYNED